MNEREGERGKSEGERERGSERGKDREKGGGGWESERKITLLYKDLCLYVNNIEF